MNRAQLQQLTTERIRDAEALLNAGQWSGAYYLAGYAVECALKACIAARTKEFDFPDKNLALRSYTHDLEALFAVAELKKLFDPDLQANPILSNYWTVVRDWDEQARYETYDESEARELLTAVTEPVDGVLKWILDHS